MEIGIEVAAAIVRCNEAGFTVKQKGDGRFIVKSQYGIEYTGRRNEFIRWTRRAIHGTTDDPT